MKPGNGLDHLDKSILALLQKDGRIPYTTMANLLGVASGTVRKRVKRLQDAGFVQVVGVTNPFRTGMDTVVFFWIKVDQSGIQQVMEELTNLQEIRYAAFSTGAFDLIAIAVLRSRQELLEFLNNKLSQVEGIRETDTSVLLEIRKQTYDWAPWAVGEHIDIDQYFDEVGAAVEDAGEVELDSMNRRIIARLQQDGRYPYADIAKQLGVTERTIRRRVAQLRRSGILRIVGVTNPFRVGMNTVAAVGVKVDRQHIEHIVTQLSANRQVRYVALSTGIYDLIFEVVMQTNRELLEFLIGYLSGLQGVRQTDTSLILKICKQRYSWGTG